MKPIPRDLKFEGPAEAVGNWSALGAHYSQWFNALSLLFPDGERFFIHSVKLAIEGRDLPPALEEQVNAFVRQEAYHAREHGRHNKSQSSQNASVGEMLFSFHHFIEGVQARLSTHVKLGLTIAAEHWTAALADVFLRFPELAETTKGAEPIGRMLIWHAVEETEHKAVAFDVYELVVGRGARAYALRMATMAMTTFFLWAMQSVIFFRLVRENGLLFYGGGWVGVFRALFLQPAFLPRLVPILLAYANPKFHPWQRDNRPVLEQALADMGWQKT